MFPRPDPPPSTRRPALQGRHPPLTMLSRQVLARAARPLARLASTNSSSTSAAVPSTSKSSGQVLPQSPNYTTTWSASQAPRPQGRSGPRFEQTAMELQPLPLSAMEMIANEPIRAVHGRKAVCDGGMHWRLLHPVSRSLSCPRRRSSRSPENIYQSSKLSFTLPNSRITDVCLGQAWSTTVRVSCS